MFQKTSVWYPQKRDKTENLWNKNKKPQGKHELWGRQSQPSGVPNERVQGFVHLLLFALVERGPCERKGRGRVGLLLARAALSVLPRNTEDKLLSTELKPPVTSISNSKFIATSYTLLETHLEILTFPFFDLSLRDSNWKPAVLDRRSQCCTDLPL